MYSYLNQAGHHLRVAVIQDYAALAISLSVPMVTGKSNIH